MSTTTYSPDQVSTLREWGSCFDSEKLHGVSASRSVRADRARIFQALTVPEYIETWFSAPGSIPGYTRVFGGDGSFSICGLAEDGSRFKIACTYRTNRRSKLIFTWQQEQLVQATPSLVRIRLQGDFERTTVDVAHTGITALERRWCQEMWEASLERLSRLF